MSFTFGSVSAAAPDYSWGSTLYNPGQDTELRDSFITSMSAIASMVDDPGAVQTQLLSEFGEEGCTQWFSDDFQSFSEQVLSSSNDDVWSSLENIFTVVVNLQMILDQIKTNPDDLSMFQSLGYYDSMSFFSIIEGISFPIQISSEMLSKINTAYSSLVEELNLDDLEALAEEADPDESAINAALKGVLNLLEETLQVSIADINPNLYSVLSGNWEDTDAVLEAIEYIKGGELVNDLVNRITSQEALSSQTKTDLQAIADDVEMLAVTPAVGYAAVGIAGRNIAAGIEQREQAMERSKLMSDKADRKAARERQSERKAEIRKGMKKESMQKTQKK